MRLSGAIARAVSLTAALTSIGCAHPNPRTAGFTPPMPSSATQADADAARSGAPNVPPGPPAMRAPDQVGDATWYGDEFAGHATTSGEPFDPRALTAAHRKLPLGTWVEVRRVDSGRTVRVRINDRGPFGSSKRIIDLSRRAAELLDMIPDGIVRVELRVVDGPGGT